MLRKGVEWKKCTFVVQYRFVRVLHSVEGFPMARSHKHQRSLGPHGGTEGHSQAYEVLGGQKRSLYSSGSNTYTKPLLVYLDFSNFRIFLRLFLYN